MDWHYTLYYGSKIVLSIVTILLLLRIANAARNVTDILDIHRQLTSNVPGPPQE